ncbi:hypothetical protein B484DRAFT_477652 [Ochromonadaceae sp. CCMP2298]|nr:hypothetical protein B484DRAFT_477652 [Ochromonadaceae sp. CCMP2298]
MILLVLALALRGVAGWTSFRPLRNAHASRLHMSDAPPNAEFSANSFPFMWRGMVLTVPDTDMDEVAVQIMSSKAKPPFQPGADDFELPMLPEAEALFPGSRSFLFINEMKFRCLFSDVGGKHGNRLVRSVVDQATGEIAPCAVVCKVVECRRFKTGETAYVILALYRVQVKALRKREPYPTCIVQAMDPLDPILYDQRVDPREAPGFREGPLLFNRYKGMVSGGEAVSYRSILECEKLCESIYTDLSLSLRLLRVAKLNRAQRGVKAVPQVGARSSGILRSSPANRGNVDQIGICLFPVLYQNRPLQAVLSNPLRDAMPEAEQRRVLELTAVLKHAIERGMPDVAAAVAGEGKSVDEVVREVEGVWKKRVATAVGAVSEVEVEVEVEEAEAEEVVEEDEVQSLSDGYESEEGGKEGEEKEEENDISCGADDDEEEEYEEEEEEEEDENVVVYLDEPEEDFDSAVEDVPVGYGKVVDVDGVDLTPLVDRHRAFSYAVCATLASPPLSKQRHLKMPTLQRLRTLAPKIHAARRTMEKESLLSGTVDEEDIEYLVGLEIGDDEDVKPPENYQLLSILNLTFEGYEEAEAEQLTTQQQGGAGERELLQDDATILRQKAEQEGGGGGGAGGAGGKEGGKGGISEALESSDSFFTPEGDEDDPWAGSVLQ